MTTTPEPKGKLDAMTTRQAVKSAGGDVVVNGPEDQTLDWHAVDWHCCPGERTASTATDLHSVAGGGPEKGPQSAEADARPAAPGSAAPPPRFGRPESTVRRWLRAVREPHAQWLYERGVDSAVLVDLELLERPGAAADRPGAWAEPARRRGRACENQEAAGPALTAVGLGGEHLED
jgi:hypothetical protein